jgi:hypothetical protein
MAQPVIPNDCGDKAAIKTANLSDNFDGAALKSVIGYLG